MKLRILFFAALAAAFVLVGCEKENQGGGKAEKPVTTINNVTAGGTFNVLGTVVAAGNEAFILSDATGVLMVYMNNHNVAVGEQVLIEGPATQEYKNNALQIAPTKITKTGKTFTPEYSPKVLSGENVAAYIAGSTCVCEEVEIKGVVSFSDGKYINVTVPGTDAQGSIKYKSIEDLSDYEGQSVVIKGYVTTTYKYLGILPYSIEIDENAAPFIFSVSESSLQFASEGGSVDVEVVVSGASGWTLAAEIAEEGFTATVSGNKVTVTAASATAYVNATLGIKLSDASGKVVDEKSISVTQAAPLPEGAVVVEKVIKDFGKENATSVDGEVLKINDDVSMTFAKGNASTAPTYYTSGEAIRMYQNGATLEVKAAEGKKILTIGLTFADNQYYIEADSGTLAAESEYRVWTGEAQKVKFTSTGKDKNHRAYISKIMVIYK